MTGEPLEHRLRFTPTDREESYYRYIAFEVPPAWPSAMVELSYDRSRATIDLGLLGPDGFRGWSGGARSSVRVAGTWATPGYLPGELAGRWSVWLGLYHVPSGGVDVVVRTGAGEPAPPPSAPLPAVPRGVPTLRRPPARPGFRWVAGDLHCHSEHSDGDLSLAALAALARGRGLDFLAITDHNTVSHFGYLEPLGTQYGLTLVPGQEVTTPLGHANAFGPVGWVDFRSPATNWAKQAQEGGGLLSINHPVVPVLGWQMDLGVPPHLVELWHQSWDRASSSPLEFWASLALVALPRPDKQLAGPVRPYWAAPVPVGGSDFHRHEQPDGTGLPRLPGNPTTWVEVPDGDGPPSVPDLIEGLRRGAVALSASPSAPTVVRLGDEWVVTNADGATLALVEGPAWSISASKPLAAAGKGSSIFSAFRAAPDEELGVAVLLDAHKRVLALCT